MVTEHRRRGFPEEWLSRTFGLCAVVNGATAIIAGIVAQVAADNLGDIGPFQVAIGLTVAAGILMLPWSENYGQSDARAKKDDDSPPQEARGLGASPRFVLPGSLRPETPRHLPPTPSQLPRGGR